MLVLLSLGEDKAACGWSGEIDTNWAVAESPPRLTPWTQGLLVPLYDWVCLALLHDRSSFILFKLCFVFSSHH